MFRPIQGLRLGLEDRRNPFDPHPDLVGQHYLFLYLTGRGEYSYIFPPTTQNDILDAAAQAIPMGYTQLWILEWINAMRPEPGKQRMPFQRRAVHHLRQDQVQEGHSYVLIGEHGQCFGFTNTWHTATGASKAIAVASTSRIVVGFLKANITWH
jgi:hypothetical protein